MEVGGGSGDDNWKRKTAAQIEILENIYVVEPFPSQELIAELSAKLGLSVQQLKVWFQYRRQKDQITIGIPLHKGASTMPMVSSIAVGEVWGQPVSGSPFGLQMVQQPGVRVPSYGNEGLSTRRYDQLPWTIQHSHAIAAVEAQLGGPLIEDGPVLGFKFDPLPPGTFRTPIEPAVHFKPGGQSHRAERHGGPIKVANQTSLQYQFTQGESSSGAAAYGPRVPPCYYSSPAEAQGTGIALSGGSSYVHGTQLRTPRLLRPRGRQPYISQSLGAHVVPQSSSRLNWRVDANFGGCSITGEENPLMPSETQAIRYNRLLAKNWKSKDENVGRKVEAQEKGLTDELIEELDTLRQKKEEQMRKQDRGKLKQKALLSEKFIVKESNKAKRMKFNKELRQKKQAARLRTVKETLELIDDKQLELIELAYFIRVLRSILTLESETLQRLRSSGDKCGEFPPKSVCLKKPFRAQRWIDSDKNVTNLLMVWRFLICFADALSLSPFTIDEFVQALHDTDSRLLGQVHIMLLRSIIKDIEGAAISGGNPRIVEGAYARDFNINSWQRHLNPLTWPEILRQFALSAGFGPDSKKRSIEPASSSDETKGDDETDTSASSPNEIAAENADSATFATMMSVLEGEYCDLSVEKRLDALVALISVAIEGNSIRIVLEERIEAASAMKKEMKAEAQLNMHRLNEQNVSNSSESCEFDQNLSITAMEHSSSFAAQPGDSNNARNLSIQESSASPDNLQLLCLECTEDKSSPQINASVDHKAEETDIYTPLQIGQDRRGNQYWQFKTSSSINDPGSGRIFVHLCGGQWRLIDSEKACLLCLPIRDFDALVESLDICGVREPQLRSMLQQIEAAFKENVRKLRKDSDRGVGNHVRYKDTRPNLYVSTFDRPEASDLGRSIAENDDVLRRYSGFEKWMWDECLDSTSLSAMKWGKGRRKKLLHVCNRCHVLHLFKERQWHRCHPTSSVSVKTPSRPVQISLLKAQLASMEDCIPKEAFESRWSKKHRKQWGLRLISASSSKDLLQLILALLDGAIKKDILASETCRDLEGIPCTTSALALRFVEVNESLHCRLHEEDS